MKILDACLILGALGCLVLLLVGSGRGGGGGIAGDTPTAAALETRLARIEGWLRGPVAEEVMAALPKLEGAVDWMERASVASGSSRAAQSDRASKPSPASDTSGAIEKASDSWGAEEKAQADELALWALAGARGIAAEVAAHLELPPDLEEEVLRIYAEHQLRLRSGRAEGLSDFPVIRQEMDAILDPERRRIFFETYAPSPEDLEDR